MKESLGQRMRSRRLAAWLPLAFLLLGVGPIGSPAGPIFNQPSLRRSGGGGSTLNNDLDRFYPLDGDATDVVGGVNGTISGPSATWSATSAWAGHQSLDLRANSANLFEATRYRDGQDYSVSYWVYATGSGQTGVGIVGNFVSTIVSGWAVVWSIFGGPLDADVFDDGAYGAGVAFKAGCATPGTVASSTWVHFVVTRSGTSCVIYRNGVAFGSGTCSASFTGGASTKLYIASRPVAAGQNATQALIQMVGLWSRALTASEALKLYNSGEPELPPFQ